jgi:nucleolysin TIA-1/TIAR
MEFGTVEEIRIQREKGFAFVRYNSHDSAARAIAYLNGRILGSKPIRVSWGKDSADRAQPYPYGGGAGPAPVYGYSAPPGGTGFYH